MAFSFIVEIAAVQGLKNNSISSKLGEIFYNEVTLRPMANQAGSSRSSLVASLLRGQIPIITDRRSPYEREQ